MPTLTVSPDTPNTGATNAEVASPFAKLHVVVGIVAFILFLGTGVYMRILQMPTLPDGLRLLYRSRHIYLLFSALLNLMVGMLYQQTERRKVQRAIGSVLLLIAPVLLLAGFFLDTKRGDLNAPLSHIGIFSAAIGTALLALAFRKRAAEK